MSLVDLAEGVVDAYYLSEDLENNEALEDAVLALRAELEKMKAAKLNFMTVVYSNLTKEERHAILDHPKVAALSTRHAFLRLLDSSYKHDKTA